MTIRNPVRKRIGLNWYDIKKTPNYIQFKNIFLFLNFFPDPVQ